MEDFDNETPSNPFKQNEAEIGDPSRVDPDLLDVKYKRGGPSIMRKIYSKASVDKLQALGFDPIEAMVNRYHKVEEILNQMLNGPRAPSTVALAQMYTLQAKIAADLIRYGYVPVPEKDAGDDEDGSTMIILTEDTKDEDGNKVSTKTTTIEIGKSNEKVNVDSGNSNDATGERS